MGNYQMTNFDGNKPMTVDFAVEARWLATVNNDDQLLENTSLIIKNEQILDILPTQQARQRYCANDVAHLNDHLVIPGLVNAHGHAAMSLLRGFADDHALQAWLEEHIWPAESAFVSEEFVYDGTFAAIAEMLATGTTCFADMYFFPQSAARAATDTGIRAYLAPPVFDFPSNWQPNPEGYLNAIEDLHRSSANTPLITVAIGPHAPYTVSDDSFTKIINTRNKLNSKLHIHCHETAHEVEESIKNYGQRPLARLAKLGAVSPDTQLVHMTQITDEDITLLQQYQPSVVHCPKSNLKLASGFCPVQKLIEAGINVALGTDGAASNNSLDMFSELQFAALLAKGASGNPEALSASQALRMATINGAKALGLEDKIGSLEIGKQADLAAIDLSANHHWPVYSPLSALAYSQAGHSVSDVWVAGQRRVKNGTLTSIDATALNDNLRQWQHKITTFKNRQSPNNEQC